MPEENTTSTEVKSALDILEDYSLSNHLSRTYNYGIITKALERDENLSFEDIKRLLVICEHDLREDVMFTTPIMIIINAILSGVQVGKYDPCLDLLPSAIAVINIIKTAALLSKADSMKVLCYTTLLAYPDDTLIAVAEQYEEVLEIFNLYCHMRIPAPVRSQAYSILHKLLKILPPEKKKNFVEKGITVWFSKIIPTIMVHMQNNQDCTMPMELLELLTDELTACDYTNNQEWQDIILQCICNGNKYPTVMKTLLEGGSQFWHRLWIVFIRLLKNQVTQSLGYGTPINSMLPVVEAAFKMDVENRCKAFDCWSVLIDSFSTETNESNINKRIKLLLIPLKSNNAKAEATAIAKFKCWWHLIRKFQNKIDKFLDVILVSFLHFCFGRHNATDKTQIIPGQISIELKKLCIQSIVDLVGHVECDGCTGLPKLNGRLINTKNLVDNWNHWVFSMTATIMMSANSDHGLTKQQMTCLWKSFLMTIGELPENNIRKDLFSEMLSILLHVVQQCKFNSNLADIVFKALILTLFDGEMRISSLLKSKNDTNDPLYKIVIMILDPSLKPAYESDSRKELVKQLKSVTDTFLDTENNAPTFMLKWLLKTLPTTDIALTLWIALVESICESKYIVCPQILANIMVWPLKSVSSFTCVKLAAMTWYTSCGYVNVQIKKNDHFVRSISQFLFVNKITTYSTVYFKLCVTLGLNKYKMCDKTVTYEKGVELLQNLSAHIDSYQKFKEIFPVLIDRVWGIISLLKLYVNETLAQNILVCIKNILPALTQAYIQQIDVSQILSFIGGLLKSLDSLFTVASYYKLIPMIVEDLIDYSSFLSKQPSIKEAVLSVMKSFASIIVETDDTFNKIKEIIDGIENNNKLDKNQNTDINEFTTPKPKEIPKKSKKKEASIVNTVVENGEEYVVVKSNWKFNPRKLTENQKEKLQRKREDIPALYQDLSQSQDEFKLVTWKTDSQDTSSTSRSESKSLQSGCNETTTQMLSNLPSSDVVPKIIENFFSENTKRESPVKDLLPVDTDVNKVVQATTPKNTKSPRMALKDRVFRNVRNLMEKSGIQKENKDASEDLNKTVNIIKTPTQSKSIDAISIVNSAPPLLSADRPSRVKRKPKKFDELLLLSAKKNRKNINDLKSDAALTATKIDTNKNESANEAVSSIVSVPEEPDVNKPGDLQATCENPTISSCNEVIQSKEITQKDFGESHNAVVDINEAQTVQVEVTKNDSKNLDLSSDSDKNHNESNENKDECPDKKQPEKSNINESSKTTDAINNGVSNNHIEADMSTDFQNQNYDDNKNEKSDDKIDESVEKTDDNLEKSTNPGTKSKKEVSTPQTPKNKVTEGQKSTTKKNSVKKSRIEKELAIDMVDGHPFLKMQTQKRSTRKTLEASAIGRRKSLVAKLNKSKTETNGTVKSDRKTKEKSKEIYSANTSFTVEESQEKDYEPKNDTQCTEDLPYSDDVIESSQDSTITTISVKSTKKSTKKIPLVTLQKIDLCENKDAQITESQSILDCVVVAVSESSKPNQESKDDIELPQNKTAEVTQEDLTENMDTEPIDEKELSVIEIHDDVPPPLTISSDETEAGPETQEIAEADTQPTDPKDFMDTDVTQDDVNKILTVEENTTNEICINKDKPESLIKDKSMSETVVNPSENTTVTLSESACADLEKEGGASSPSSFREEAKRKQDFLNNTLEISPIKNMSPERAKKSLSPENSSDYVVIKLSSPVQSNGEPFEKCGSPEVFTEEKVSPDKRDQSPPRVEVTVTNTSPSSSLSLKKNRPQVRSGGRAAQMLVLCVPDKLQTIINTDKNEIEEIKKAASSTPARRNLRILYNSASENTEVVSKNDDSENFLKFRRSLPSVDCSPSGPILKRKLIEITDEATMSPASKRKRVSFHDPPVSTTISVQKYIEPAGVRSPQNSAQKRLERQLRQHTPIKSPKRLDHAFKLDTVLTKAIESFSETDIISIPDDTQPFSLDETPVVEIVRASELNDTDPICPELLDCNDPIDNIASELSSSAMKSLLVQELVGKVETVGDLAKMTELEVNRLCIKAPKVKVAKKVLSDYASKRVEKPPSDIMVTIDEAIFDDPMPDPELKVVDIEVQTDRNTTQEMEVQTHTKPTTATYVQTETKPIAHTIVQTDESGSTSTADLIKLCLAERPDFVEQVGLHLEESSIRDIAERLPFNAITDVLMNKVNSSNSTSLLSRILDKQSDDPTENRGNKKLKFLRDYMCDRFDSKDLIIFCSEVLKTVYDKS